MLKQVSRRAEAVDSPEICSDHRSCGSDITFCCGRPFEQAFREDRCYFFIRYLYPDTAPNIQRKRFLINFKIKHDIFHCFFGSGLWGNSMPTASSPDTATAAEGPFTSRLAQSCSTAPSTEVGTHSEDSRPLEELSQGIRQDTFALEALREEVQKQYQPNTMLTVIEPLENDKFSIQRYVVRPLGDPNLHLSKPPKTRGAILDHLYLTINAKSECKFIIIGTVMKNPSCVGKAVAIVPVGIVDSMKDKFHRSLL